MTAGTHKAAARRRFSPITRRILTVNVLALVILAAGFSYIAEYRQALIAAEMDMLQTRAEILAAALAEGAVTQEGTDVFHLYPPMARQMLATISRTTLGQARLFSADGALIADSSHISEGGGITIEVLPPPMGEENAMQKLLRLYEAAASWLPGQGELDPYPETSELAATDFAPAMDALHGEAGRALHRGRDSSAILSVAVPVQRYKRVLGALMVSMDSTRIDAALFQIRLDILKVFGLTLAVTVLMSLYLAGSIARPLRHLAAGAERLRQTLSRQHAIPELAGRHDEIGELSHALRDMTEALWTRMDAIEGFAADVAHEIKNPLTSLRSAVETAARLTDAQQQRHLMGIILDDVQRLDRLIGDISDASRLDAELSRAETETVDVEKMLTMLVNVQATIEDAKAPPLELNIVGPGPFSVLGLEGRLVQVFRNLIGNAATFSPKDRPVRLSLYREQDLLVITVDDDGPGIPEGKEEAIFDRFYSERPESEKFGTHSGLGLSISRQIIEAHSGSLAATNRRDPEGRIGGASFRITLPAR